MIIRPLIYQDRAKILRLIERRGTFNKKEIRVAMELIDETLRHPERKDYHIFCAINSQDTIAGYICVGLIPMTESRYNLYWIVVDEGFSRKGIGGRLLEFMEGFLGKKKARRFYVETSSSPAYEAARSFYQKQGYLVVCVLGDFYRKGDHKMIFMKEL